MVFEEVVNMSENHLVLRSQLLPAKETKEEQEILSENVTYELIDAEHYSFYWMMNEAVRIKMDESDRSDAYTDFVDADFEEVVEESVKRYYHIAAAAGILTGTLSMVHLNSQQISNINDFKEKEWKPIIVSLAMMLGYKKRDFKGAVKYIFNRAIVYVKKDENVHENFVVLAAHPSVAGLICSILTQCSEKRILLSENGEIKMDKLLANYVIGKDYKEKIVLAFFYWLFELLFNMAKSKRHILDELSIPKDILALIKDFINIPWIKNIPTNKVQAEQKYSEWLKELISDVDFEKKEDEDTFLHGNLNRIFEDSFPVILNEGIICSLFIILKVLEEVRHRKIKTIEEMKSLPYTQIFFDGSRVLSRMTLISSACFAGINVCGAVIKGVAGKKAGKGDFAKVFLAEIDIVGVGYFIFACANDGRYIAENLKAVFNRKEKSEHTDQKDEYFFTEENSAFDSMVLDGLQARILYSLEYAEINYDISQTKKPKDALLKDEWCKEWKKILLGGLNLPPEISEVYLIEDEDILYDGIYKLAKDKENWRWFYLMTQELILFKLYNGLGVKKDKEFGKLKQESDYIRDQFIRRQVIVTQDEIDTIQKMYSKYKKYIDGSGQKAVWGLGTMAVVAAATGGVALACAPGIAAAIAGEAVVGLHGAALTSASLAFVGGGSLAAGGLGMAGGTAIITGGGALLGLAGSGSVSAAVMLHTPSGYWVRQGAKLLTYCKCILYEKYQDADALNSFICTLQQAEKNIEHEIKDIEEENNDLDKQLLKDLNEYLKILKKCSGELKKLIA